MKETHDDGRMIIDKGRRIKNTHYKVRKTIETHDKRKNTIDTRDE